MAVIRVTPIEDKASLRGSWAVTKNGSRQSPLHRKKTAARRHAQRVAESGDRLEIRRLNGTVQEARTV